MIKRFSEYLNEGNKDSEFGLDDRFEWAQDIENLIRIVLDRVDVLKTEFNYNRHKHTDSFEFDIKQRGSLNLDILTQKFQISEDYIYDLYQKFLNENLEVYSDDVIETTEFFENWITAGRSGGWLCFKYRSYLFDEPQDYIQDIVNTLNDSTDEISDEDFEHYENIKNASVSAHRLLIRIGAEHIPEDIVYAENESKKVKQDLHNELEKLNRLEEELKLIRKDIHEFWKNSESYFKEFLESEMEE